MPLAVFSMEYAHWSSSDPFDIVRHPSVDLGMSNSYVLGSEIEISGTEIYGRYSHTPRTAGASTTTRGGT